MNSPHEIYRILIIAAASFYCGYLFSTVPGKTPLPKPGLDPAGQHFTFSQTSEDRHHLAGPKSSAAADHAESIAQAEEQMRQAMARDRQEYVKKTAAERAPKYDQFFSELGLATNQAQTLKSQLSKIFGASLECEMATGELMTERLRFQEMLHTLLNQSQQAQYEAYEKSKPAVREFESFQDFLAKTGKPTVDSTNAKRIIGLVLETKAFTSKTWDGPFDGLPQPTRGTAMTMAKFEAELEELAALAGKIQKRAEETGLPEVYKASLQQYYQEKMQERSNIIAKLRMPPSKQPDPKIMAEMMKAQSARKRTNQAGAHGFNAAN